MNPYFNPSGQPANNTRAIAAVVRTVFEQIALGFDKLPSIAQLWSGSANYAADTGTANAYVVALSPLVTAYADGMMLAFKTANANTAASTLNVNGLGLKAIRRADGSPLQTGDIKAGQIVSVRYDGVNFQLAGTGAAVDAAAASASATAAGISATAADTARGLAVTARTGAETAQGLAEAAFDSFDDRYLGAKASDPTLDNDGAALLTGAIYWNIGAARFRIWSGSAWTDGVVPDNSYLLRAGGNMTGGLNEARGADIASAATLSSIWTAGQGNVIGITGTTATTSFGTAPQAGASRVLIAAGAWPLTQGANLLLPGGANYTCAAGDMLVVTALTTTQHRVVIFKADGSSVAVTGAASVNLQIENVSTARSQIDFLNLDGALYDYEIRFSGYAGTTGAGLSLRTSSNNGSSFAAAGGDYYDIGMSISRSLTTNDPGSVGASNRTSIVVAGLAFGADASTTTQSSIAGNIRLFDLANTNTFKLVQSECTYWSNANTRLNRESLGGSRQSAAAVNAVRLFADGTTIARGQFILIGHKRT